MDIGSLLIGAVGFAVILILALLAIKAGQFILKLILWLLVLGGIGAALFFLH